MTPNLSKPYEYSKGYIICRLDFAVLPAIIQIGGTEFRAKQEKLHCSLVATKKIIPLIIARDQLSEAAAEQKVVTAVAKIIESVKPQFEVYKNEFRIAEKPELQRKTLLIMAKVSGIERVFQKIKQALNLEMPVQPAHVTIYTLPNETPIGVTSQAELAEFTRPLSPNEQEELHQQIDTSAIFEVSV